MHATTLYFTDNGRVLCRDHLGCSAQYTGRDISGQPIERVTAADQAHAQREAGRPFSCETCDAIGRRR